MDDSASTPSTDSSYTVVARRYRPKSFDQLIGQEHVAQALSRAIETCRVGHAYLFTGARGVGKTSTARIFAKALNATDDVAPDLAAEIAEAVDAGDDMDVIEIDGASNRGINEIRQLRANVNVRPSRAKYKIYIIDEVHMLTKEAFNALLKTLEEPPSHVKFIFCTTDADKIPITVLSRCQRFDFVPVKFESIIKRLLEIAQAEGYQTEPEALGLLARRAAGSMRDSQSLLEQVMSFSTGVITAQQVHALLGIADEGLLIDLVKTLAGRDALTAIATAAQAQAGGADAGQLAEQLLNYLRDIMAVGVGGDAQLLKFAGPASHPQLAEIAQQWGLQTVLSAIQILDESLVRMKSSVSASTLLEVALVQICQLQSLASIPALLSALGQLPDSPPVQKKKTDSLNRSSQNQPLVDPGIASRISSAVTHPTTPASRPTSVKSIDASSVSSITSPRADVPEPHFQTALSLPVSVVKTSHLVDPQVDLISSGLAGHPIAPLQNGPVLKAELSEPLAASAAVATPTAASRTAPANASEPHTSSTSKSNGQSRSRSSDVIPQPAPTSEAASKFGTLASADALKQWKQATGHIEGLLSDYAEMVIAVEARDGQNWRVYFPPGAKQARDYCEQAVRKSQLTGALSEFLGRPMLLSIEVQAGNPHTSIAAGPTSSAAQRSQKLREVANNPLIKKICEVMDGEIVKVMPAQRIPVPPLGPQRS